MAAPFNTKIEVTGPIFDGSGLRVMQGIVNRGLLDLATIEGANKVSDELWGPPAHLYSQSKEADRHGAHTRVLKRAIFAHHIRDNVAEVNAKGPRNNVDLQYAGKVEARYHMFEKVTNAINRNKAALQDKYIGDAVVEAFQ
jgi:hypothetical protein